MVPPLFFRHQMRNAVADMLLAEPSRIATAQTEVQEHIEHQSLFAAERPALLELLDHLDGPCKVSFAVAAIDLDSIGLAILVVQVMLYRPFEQGACGVVPSVANRMRVARL